MPPYDHHAQYDQNGDIILPEEGWNGVLPEGSHEPEIVAWNAPKSDDASPKSEAVVKATSTSPIERGITHLRSAAHGIIDEGAEQYRTSVYEGVDVLRALHTESQSLWKRLKDFLLSPVWVPGRKKRIVERSRIGLFFIDIIRFGGTFAAIFIVLFSAMNYESLWDIVTPKVAALFSPPSLDDPGNSTQAASAKLKDVPLLTEAGTRRRSLRFLPDVGPPDNQLIIARLKLHVPLMEPPTANLLKGDWPKVEEDIQSALLQGVVLYPGTARPGQAGNVFITGHSSYYAFVRSKYKSVFARLSELEPGDEYWIIYGGDRHRYIVQSKKIVSPSDITVLDQPLNQRIATLMTCSPVGTTLKRQVVLAQEVDPATGIALQIGEKAERTVQKVQLEALPI